MIEGVSPHLVHLVLALLLGALLARWRDVAALLREMSTATQPDPDDPYEDMVHDPQWTDEDVMGDLRWDGEAFGVGPQGGHAFMGLGPNSSVTWRNEWPADWD